MQRLNEPICTARTSRSVPCNRTVQSYRLTVPCVLLYRCTCTAPHSSTAGGGPAPWSVTSGGVANVSDISRNVERVDHLDDPLQARIYDAETSKVPGGLLRFHVSVSCQPRFHQHCVHMPWTALNCAHLVQITDFDIVAVHASSLVLPPVPAGAGSTL